MVYFGKVKNGRIELDPAAKLPEGTTVRVEPVENGAPKPNGVPPTEDLGYRLAELAMDFGADDVAREHDHYIYGTPKRGKP